MYKFWKLDNIKTETTNNNGDVFIYYLQFEFLNSGLGDNISKVSVESGDKSSILLEDSGGLISPNNKRDVWYYIYELETPDMLSKVYYKNYNDWGQAWQTADLSFSSDGVEWFSYDTLKTPDLKSYSPVITRTYQISENIINQFKSYSKTSYKYWRVSNIKNRRADQFYRSVGNLIFKAKSGEVSDNPDYGFSESHFDSDSFPGNAFDGLNTTYTLSSSLEGGLNSEEHGKSWWLGYKFLNPVELESIKVSMRYDMEEESLGQEWTYFNVDGSNDGISWTLVSIVNEPKIFKNDTSEHIYSFLDKEIKSKYWRIKNIYVNIMDSAPDTQIYKWMSINASILNFKDISNNIKSIGGTAIASSFQVGADAANAFDNNPNTLWHCNWKSGLINKNNYMEEYIGYISPEAYTLHSIDYKPIVQDINQEWIRADIEYSLNEGVNWINYGYIFPNTANKDQTLKENLFIQNFNLKYSIPNISGVYKYKFWRCNNINTLPSYTNLSFAVSGSILKFINKEDLNLTNLNNSFSSNYAKEEVGSGVASNGFDNNPLTWFHSQYPIDQTNILKNYENYSIGCMFEEPVEVVKIGYQSRPNMDINWGQTWQSCNVQYSPNGFDWFIKGYCDFNMERVQPEYIEKNIMSLDTLDLYKFWRISKVFNKGSSQYPQYGGYTQGFSGWELRFNTLSGESSNIPSRGFSNGFWDNFWTPNRAFDGDVSTSAGGFHQKQNNDVEFYIGYEFIEPQYVTSISILSRRDTNAPHQNWLFAHIEASKDGINWVPKGYANLNVETNTRFYLSKLEFESLFDKLKYSYINSLQNTNLNTFKRIPFSSKYLDPKITNLNIYNPNSNGVVKGQVLELNEPVIREVAIYDRRTRQLIAITWSNEEGFYEFKNLNSSKTYYVHAIDSNKIYNAVTKDMLELLK